jgi:hypothetical protein
MRKFLLATIASVAGMLIAAAAQSNQYYTGKIVSYSTQFGPSPGCIGVGVDVTNPAVGPMQFTLLQMQSNPPEPYQPVLDYQAVLANYYGAKNEDERQPVSFWVSADPQVEEACSVGGSKFPVMWAVGTGN